MKIEDDSFIVDFVAKEDNEELWRLVLVEEGPLNCSVNEFLSSLQERMYNALDAVIDGQVAEKFPGSKGKDVIVQLDCYNLPREEIEGFFNSFSSGIFQAEDYKNAVENNIYVKTIQFLINFD